MDIQKANWKIVRGSKPVIEAIVSRLHVGTKLGAVFSHVVGKITDGRAVFRKMSPALKKEFVRIIGSAHDRNRNTYAQVVNRRDRARSCMPQALR